MMKMRSPLLLALPLVWHSALAVRDHVDLDSLAASDGGDVADLLLGGVEDAGPPGFGGYRAPSTRRRRSAEEERRKAEAHRKANLQDCVVEEELGTWSECSASCGGGVQTAEVLRREIKTPQDKFGYGKPCPSQNRRFRPCKEEMCSTDCSTVDLNNRLPTVGGAVKWTFEKAPGDSGHCVFQFWQVLSGGATPRLCLLGQTLPQQAPEQGDAAVYDATTPEPAVVALSLVAADGVAPGGVAVGFRGCALRGLAEEPLVAKICLWGADAFPPAKPGTLDAQQEAALAEYRSASHARSGDLARLAGTQAGVGAGDDHVSFKGAGADPGFDFRPTMAPQPPAPPVFDRSSDLGDDIAIVFRPPLDHGAAVEPGYTVALRRRFMKLADRGNECEPVPVRSCSESAGETCFEPSGPGLVLRNLVLASTYELHVAARNAVGWGRKAAFIVQSRAKTGTPASQCSVDYWSCAEVGYEGANDLLPKKGQPHCSLTASPVPPCSQKGKEGKCDGKKYFRTCKPIMSKGDPSCVGELKGVCEWSAPKYDPQPKCAAAGCSKAFFWFNQKRCCCLPKVDGSAEDSPNCACIADKCAAAGLVDAKNPASCRH